MYNFYRKEPSNFSLILIGSYCLLQSLGNGISHSLGIPKSANAILALIQSIFLLWWLHKYGLFRTFRLGKPTQPAKHLAYYLPLILISSFNLWLGIRGNLSPTALIFHILLMLCVGFLEELLFRGFLFEALRKENPRTATVVSSLTFGVGHILNLFNGSGMDLRAVIVQIVFAVLLGYLFVTLYLRSGSLLPCILSHQAINILSAFANHQASGARLMTVNLAEIFLILLYLVLLFKMAPVQNPEDGREND